MSFISKFNGKAKTARRLSLDFMLFLMEIFEPKEYEEVKDIKLLTLVGPKGEGKFASYDEALENKMNSILEIILGGRRIVPENLVKIRSFDGIDSKDIEYMVYARKEVQHVKNS